MTPHELQRLAFEFRVSRAISCALELGVYRTLGRGTADAKTLADRCGVDERGLRILLDALVPIGVLEALEGGYRVQPDLLPALLEDEPDYLGNLLLHDLWHWTSWARLDDVVRRGRRLEERGGDPHLTDPEVLRRFLPNYVEAMDQCAGDAPRTLVERLAALTPRRALDLAGGLGANLIGLCRALPGVHGVLADLGFNLEPARQRVHEAGLDARIEVKVLDFERDPLPGGHDLILISRVLMGLTPERAEALVARCALALEPGGWIAIHDYLPGTRVGALLSLDMLLNTGGQVHDPETLSGWLEAAGLKQLENAAVLPYTSLFLGRKPLEENAA